MAVFKCKMCGGDLEIQEGLTICECEYCGTKQTIPALDNEKKLNLFNRANRLRLNSEFDKAASIYENIIAEFPEEAEGYWGLVLCNYGIEYVDDPATAKKIPTCHRAAFESVTKDENYELALEYADVVSQKVYRDEAHEIDRIMSEILSISKNEEPYDIFICYKETDTSGGRTIDSVIAQDVYDALTDKGYRVFFSRISLEDKLGSAYEPYIFAALNSAKVMLAFGTKYEYFHAVWVKNEWSRFLKLMAKDKSKSLVPCYKDLDPYDMPDEFKALQAQDMGKVGAIQDLVRGIEKLVGSEKTKEPVVINSNVRTDIAPLLKRAFMFLEDCEWVNADEYCEKVLDINPECAEAYLCKLMVELKVKKEEKLKDCPQPFDSTNNYKKALRFADSKLKEQLTTYIEFIKNRNENARIEGIYIKALTAKSDEKILSYHEAIQLFESVEDYKDARSLKDECFEELYLLIKNCMFNAKTEKEILNVIEEFERIKQYKDSADLILECKNKIKEIHLNQKYTEAIDLINKAVNEHVFSKGIRHLKSLGDYKNSAELVNKYKHDWDFRESMAMDIWATYISTKEQIITVENERQQIQGLSDDEKKEKTRCKTQIEELKKKEDFVVSAKVEIANLNEELNKLGVLAFSKKKEISTKIKELTRQLNVAESVVNKKTSLEGGFQSDIAECNRKISECKNKLSSIDFQLAELNEQLNRQLAKLEQPKFIAVLCQKEEVLPLLAEEDSIVSIIKRNNDLKDIIKQSCMQMFLPADKQKTIFKIVNFDVEAVYFQACQAMETARSLDDIKWARGEFASIPKYKDALVLRDKCDEMLASNKYKLKFRMF